MTRWPSRPSSCTWCEEKSVGADRPGPARVDGDGKAGLLDLVGYAVEAGWSLRRVCGLLDVNHRRVLSWRDRLAYGGDLADATPGPTQAPHALLDWEHDAVCAVYDDWHEVDRSYRKLAHRGSREDRVHASESTFWRVLTAEGSSWPSRDASRWRAGRGRTGSSTGRARYGGHDFTHFTRAKRVAIAVLDLVSRYWLATLVSSEETSEQVTAAFSSPSSSPRSTGRDGCSHTSASSSHSAPTTTPGRSCSP